MRKILSLLAVLTLAFGVLPPGVAQAATGDPLVFHELTPCAVFDTRPSQGGTGALAGGESRTFHVVGSTSDFAGQGGTAGGCGIPGFDGTTPQTEMVYLNLVAVDPAAGGNLKIWATDDTEPQGGVVNYQKLTPNLNTSNSIIVGVRQDTEGSDITVKANVSSTHVRGVALGYLTPGQVSFWALEGNSGTDPAVNFLGTTDDTALNFRVNDQRALRLEPNAISPNVIGGFSGNEVTAGALGATIGGGGASTFTNRVTDDYGTVGGGLNNLVGDGAGTTSDSQYATVGGGLGNTASGVRATVGGGGGNEATGLNATVGGGFVNTATGDVATVGGGGSNTASGQQATVGGGASNTASGPQATVGGGGSNTASGANATVAGGFANTAAGTVSFAAGNRAKVNHDGAFVWADSTDADFASSALNEFAVRAGGGVRFVVGGNTCSLDSGTGAWTGSCAPPGGGSSGWLLEGNAGTDPTTDFVGTTDNTALNFRVNGARAFRLEPGTSPNVIGGFSGNSVTGGVVGATISGGGEAGLVNQVSASLGTVGGGHGNTASGARATVGGGVLNTASGDSATVPGGQSNTAAGNFSFAAGLRAKANHQGAFVWGDSQFADVASTGANQFIVRASGGIWLGTTTSPSIPAGQFLSTSTGAHLTTGGVWTNASSRSIKAGFSPVDPGEVLDQVASLPITTWHYQAEPGVIHIGPVSEDFHAAFGVGGDDRTIGTVDADGVALAAIQGLNQKLEAEVASLRQELSSGRGTDGTGLPQGGWWALAGALALLALAVGRRWGRATARA
jgi:hypothetical protein